MLAPVKRYLGIDYGSKRIGLALGDDITRVAVPLATVEAAGSLEQQVAAVRRAARDYEVHALVIGLPLNMDDSEGPAAAAALAFGTALGRITGLPVSYVDERLSTRTASDLLIPAGLTRKKKKSRVDRVAAQVLLQTFLDELPNPAGSSSRRGRELGVIFDVDGVLVDSASAHLRSWHLLAIELGWTIDDAVFARTFGRTNADIVPLLFGEVAFEESRRLADRKEELYRGLIRDAPPIVPGAKRLIDELHAAGARLAVGSSAPSANIDLILDALDAHQRIPHVVSGDDITRGKPDPEVFLKACARLDLPPGRCVVIEDAPVGVLAAKAAGAQAVAVLIHHAAAEFSTADLLTRRLEDLTVDALAALVEA